MKIWRKIQGGLNTTKKRVIFAAKTIFSSQKSIFRWSLALNFAALFGLLAYRSVLHLFIQEQLRMISTKQAQMLSETVIPQMFRKPFYSLFCKYYQVNTQEIQKQLDQYPTFSSFFTRKIIREKLEQIPNTVLSPCDGKILSFGQVTADQCHIIKNNHYSLSQLVLANNPENIKVQQFLKQNPSNKLYQVIIYLSPKDYHRFHSPVDLSILKIKDIEGDCQKVNEYTLQKGKPIYEKNARKVVFGSWKQGLITMIMVGALNVTRIIITEQKSLKAGEELGFFNLGSTIVMLTEAKSIKQWKKQAGDSIKYGQALFEYVI